MLTRDEALMLLKKTDTPDQLFGHALASEAVMRALAERLGQDVDVWGITGLLHDIDYPKLGDDMSRHGILGAQMLEGSLPEEALHAIRAHNGEMNGVAPETQLDYALRCGETVTGMIFAATFVRPTGIEGMEASSIKKKMKDKAFAASVSRTNIKQCSEIGLELSDFLQLAIDAVTPYGEKLGLTK